MEIQTITGLVLSSYQDLISRTSYLKMLTTQNCQLVKLNGLKDEFRYHYLLSSSYLLTIEIVKTRKNWVLKNILNSKQVFFAKNFDDYQRLAEYIHYLDKQLLENQQTKALKEVLINLGQFDFSKTPIKTLRQNVDAALGFA